MPRPARLQGQRHNPPLARLGVRQAEATRDFLAIRPIDHCYCSPLLRAVQTAAIVAAPHGLSPQPIETLTECDVGRWEGLDWQTIRTLDADGFQRFHANPAEFGYPGGESFRDVYRARDAGPRRTACRSTRASRSWSSRITSSTAPIWPVFWV